MIEQSTNKDSLEDRVTRRNLWLLVLFVIVGLIRIPIEHLESFAPYKDEHKYFANAAAWLSGEAMPWPAFSPLHSLFVAWLPEASQAGVLYSLNVFWMALACFFACKIFHQALPKGRWEWVWYGLAFWASPVVVFVGYSLLAEPLALAGLLCALWLSQREGKDGTKLRVLILLATTIASAARMDYFFYGIGLAAALFIFGDRRWMRLGGMALGAILGLVLLALIDASMGAEFSLFRSHGGLERVGAEPLLVAKRLGAGIVDFAFVGWSYWFAPPLRWLGVIGVLLFARREGMAKARPLLALMLAGGLVFVLTDVSNIVRGDGYLWRYFLPWIAASAFGLVYLLRLGQAWLDLRLKNNFAVLTFLAIVASFVVFNIRSVGLYPQEYLALEEQVALRAIEHEDDHTVLAERTALGQYFGKEITHTYPIRLGETTPSELLEYARAEKIEWIILQNRWQGLSAKELGKWVAAGSPLLKDYELSTTIPMESKDGRVLYVLKRRD